MAVKGGHIHIVEKLVNSDTDINTKDIKGVSTYGNISEYEFELACLIIITKYMSTNCLSCLIISKINSLVYLI